MSTVPFDVNISSGKTNSFEELQQLLDLKDDIQNKLAEQFAADLKINAGRVLHSTKDQYFEAITIDAGTVTLDTERFIVGMVENGVPSFDMKPGFLKSPKVKVSKNGSRYMVIPISNTSNGKYNWRDQTTGQFKKSTSGVKGKEFRVVSDKSAPDSWIFPSVEGNHFIEKTLNTFDDNQFDNMINDQLNKLFE